MNPRYFIGISLPGELTKKLEKLQHELLNAQNIMEPLVPHITLLHPNILMTLSPLYFVPQVKEVSKSLLPFTVELTKTAMFDDRVLYIAVKSPELTNLQSKLVSLLPSDIQARYEVGRDYKPHITLVQAKPLQSLDTELIARINLQLGKHLPAKFEVTELTQFKSLGPRKYKIESI